MTLLFRRLVPRAYPLFITAVLAAACNSSNTPTSPGSTPETSTPAPDTSPSPSPNASDTARYRLTFDATWSSATHPADFPAAAHFSALVGGTHDGTVSFWREGGLATTGIKDMAERGRTSPLDEEIAAAIRAGAAGRVAVGGGIGVSPGSISLEFEISQRHSLATFVSMVAPSPDWFVGVTGLALFENGQWVGERRVELIPWDAGTDSGATFTSPDRETAPRATISRILAAPLSPNGVARPMGTFTFTRLN
jgi:hypothetical protein